MSPGIGSVVRVMILTVPREFSLGFGRAGAAGLLALAAGDFTVNLGAAGVEGDARAEGGEAGGLPD